MLGPRERLSQAPLVLVVEDDQALRRTLARTLREGGNRTLTAATAAAAVRLVRLRAPDAALVDLHLPDGSGLDLLGELRRLDPGLPVVVLTAYGSVPTAVAAMRRGAVDFLEKPLGEAALRAAVTQALRHRPPTATGLLGESAAIRRVRQAVASVRRHPRAPVLVLGESGTGKELVARAIHGGGKKPFVALNCAAVPEALLESELFGYVGGAFTGAAPGGKEGLLDAAAGGTLLLDEVGDMPPALQAKLLRVLEERCFRPVGATRDRPLACRIVASTHRDLEAAVREGRFRSDLYFRLKVLEIRLPPLRQRPEDILPLARHFLAQAARELEHPVRGFTAAAARTLRAHPWPGNVRELRNVVEHAALLAAGGWVDVPHLGLREEEAAPLPGASLRLKDLEAAAIRQALARTGGNVTHAARLLGIHRSTLYSRLGRRR